MNMKTCFKCKRDLDESRFYAHPMMADGLLGKCKDCTKKDSLEVRAKRIEYYREYDRERGITKKRRDAVKAHHKKKKNESPDEYREKRRIVNANYRKRYRGKSLAQCSARRAVASGKIKKLPCFVCGKKRDVEAHHEDYSKPLEVVWLCPKHHAEHHRKIRAEKRKGV
jgi:hypothetical protein